jgi:hypothetical protein
VKASPTDGTASVVHPFQTSWVTSLRTTQVGPSGRGRLYWPATGVTLDPDTYRPIAGTVAAALAGVKTYLGGIQTAVRVTFASSTLTVWSRKLATSNMVTSIQMGDILDVQRRRRDALVESYATLSFP